MFIILFFITIIRDIVWSCLYKFQTYCIKEKDVAKAVLQKSDGSPEKYFESLVFLYNNIYQDCPECESICKAIVQTLLLAQEIHDPTSYEEIEDILKQVSLGLEMTNLNDLTITSELLFTLQDENSKENLKRGTIWWLWDCTIFGGALNHCPHNKLPFCIDIKYQAFNPQIYRPAKYKVPLDVGFTTSKSWLTTSTKNSHLSRRNNPKKGSKSKRKMNKKCC